MGLGGERKKGGWWGGKNLVFDDVEGEELDGGYQEGGPGLHCFCGMGCR